VESLTPPAQSIPEILALQHGVAANAVKNGQKKLSTKKFEHPSMFYFFTKLPKFHRDGRGWQWLQRAV